MLQVLFDHFTLFLPKLDPQQANQLMGKKIDSRFLAILSKYFTERHAQSWELLLELWKAVEVVVEA